MTPAPSAEAIMSAAPPTTGVPAARPVSAAPCVDRADDLMGGPLWRDGIRADMGEPHQFVVDLRRRDIDEACFERPVLLDRAGAGQASSM